MSSSDGGDWGDSEWWDAALALVSSDPEWWGLEDAVDHDGEIPTDIDALVNICVDKRLTALHEIWDFLSKAPTEKMIKDMVESAKKHTSLTAFIKHTVDCGHADDIWKFGEETETNLEEVTEFVTYLTKQHLGIPPTPTSAPKTPPYRRLKKLSTERALSGLISHEGENVYSSKWGESGLIFKS